VRARVGRRTFSGVASLADLDCGSLGCCDDTGIVARTPHGLAGDEPARVGIGGSSTGTVIVCTQVGRDRRESLAASQRGIDCVPGGFDSAHGTRMSRRIVDIRSWGQRRLGPPPGRRAESGVGMG
jgi:hypothetical protein